MTTPNNNHDNNSRQNVDASLESLYQKRKLKHTSPSAVQHEILNTLARSTTAATPWWKINFKPYMQISAVACSVAVAFIVISIQLVNNNPPPLALESADLADFQSVELHVLAPKAKQVASTQLSRSIATKERKVQYQSAQNVYMERQADLVIHQQGYATIVNSEEGLSLLTCDKNLLKLSQEVVDLLMSRHEKNTVDFSKGQMVALTFDDNGHIIDIRKEIKKTEC